MKTHDIYHNIISNKRLYILFNIVRTLTRPVNVNRNLLCLHLEEERNNYNKRVNVMVQNQLNYNNHYIES